MVLVVAVAAAVVSIAGVAAAAVPRDGENKIRFKLPN